MTKKEFDSIAKSYLYLDGATGSNLVRAGMPSGVCPEQWILEHHINERQARALLRLEDPEKLLTAVEYIEEQHLNVVQTEEYIDGLLDVPQEPPHRQRLCPIVKDVRLFFNTINKAIHVMNQSGIDASAERLEKEDHIEYIVRIPLSAAR